ncbi:MAG: AsmA-like C-terminal region-containing protein [Rubripirellula sp.]
MNGIKDGPASRKPRRLSRLFVFALFCLGMSFVIYTLAPQTVGETARRHLLCQLQTHYKNHTVSIRRGHFDPKVGFTFEDLRITDNSPSTFSFRSREVLRIERLTVVTDVEPEKLLDQKNPLKTRRLILDGVHTNVWLNEAGQPSFNDLLPLPKMGPVTPRMELRRVRVNLVDGQSKGRPVTAELDELLLVNTPTADGGVDKSITFRGSTDFANDLLVQIDTRGKSIDVRCAAKGAFLSRDLFDRLPAKWAAMTKHVQELQCMCDASLALHQSADGQLNYQLRTTVHDGRFSHPALPKPIAQLRGIVVCDPGGITIEASHAHLGDAVVRVTGRVEGYQWPCETKLYVSTQGLLLDDRLAAALPPKVQTAWAKLSPLGRVDIDANLDFKANKWATDATVICKGVDVRFDKFPYPVESIVGRIKVQGGIASSEFLGGRLGGNPMRCKFRLPIQPDAAVEKSFSIETDGPVAIDNTLLNSLSPRGSIAATSLESFIRSLKPRGSIQLATANFTTDAQGRKSRKIDLRVIDGYIRYEKFKYPLYNVAGKIQIDDDIVNIMGLRGTNTNSGTVHCDGVYRMPRKSPEKTIRISDLPSEDDGSRLALRFHSNNVPMDNALRSSLQRSTQDVWDAIEPSGILDELSVQLEQQGGGTPIQLNLLANQKDRDRVTSQTLSLRPSSLPYRIDVTGGTVSFDGESVEIKSLRGRHDASTLSAAGRCIQNDQGRWELLLELHSGSRLHPDAELIAALPNQMREAMRVLQLRGPMSIRGQTRIALPDATHEEPAIQWNLNLQLEGNRIADVGPVHSLRGGLWVAGKRDERGINAFGTVDIDSMHVHDLQITDIQGPFSIADDLLSLGSLASVPNPTHRTADNSATRSIRGRLFDGALDLDGKVLLANGNFDVGLTVSNAQMPTILADFGHSDNELTGTCSGQTQLKGNLGRIDLLKGSGAAQVTDANLYKLPLVVQVMNLLRVTPTEDVAFTDGEVEFTVFGETMTFNDLQIWGDLIALQGGGTLDRKHELDLTFNSRVSPQNAFTKMVPLGQRYTLWTIDVKGPLDSISIQRRAFDGVGETLELLFPGMTDTDVAEKPSTGFGRWLRQ